MSCVERYFETEEQPTLGFVPDAEFPIIHAEKGISELDVSFKDGEAGGEAAFRLLSVESGERYNMVPDHATAILEDVKDFDKVASAFKTFLANHPVEGTLEENGKSVKINIVGKSAHAMEPNNGVNNWSTFSRFPW